MGTVKQPPVQPCGTGPPPRQGETCTPWWSADSLASGVLSASQQLVLLSLVFQRRVSLKRHGAWFFAHGSRLWVTGPFLRWGVIILSSRMWVPPDNLPQQHVGAC